MCELPPEMQDPELSERVQTIFAESDIIIHSMFNILVENVRKPEEVSNGN